MRRYGRARSFSVAALMFASVLLVTAVPAGAQVVDLPDGRAAGADQARTVVDDRLSLAIASPIYPVTPGDVYTLSFLQAGVPVTTQVQVQSDYTINMGVFGRINARGLTLAQLRPRVEGIIDDAYPRSLPTLSIASVGLFEVTLRGSIPRTTRVTAWGLSRLSDVVAGNTGGYTSLRQVALVRDGRRSTYDVFRAIDQGDDAQDPLVRPGDAVEFATRDLVVSVRGAVNAPGQYELLANEGFRELRAFAAGLTASADVSRLIVRRQLGQTVDEIALPGIRAAEAFRFRSGDILIVPSTIVPRQVIFVEGAVRVDLDVGLGPDGGLIAPAYNRFSRELTAGDTLYGLLLEIQDEISPFADLQRSYIIRRDVPEPIRIDMRAVLFRQSEFEDFVLLPFDRVVIPLDAPYVVVSGNVTNTGRIPYNPGEDFTYYLNLAGTGAESLREIAASAQIFNRDGDLVPRDRPVQAGYTIHVPPQAPRIVVVSGQVPSPGAFDHIPQRGFTHYLRLAGIGAADLARVRERVEIYDSEGRLLDATAPISTEYTIHVPVDPELPPGMDFVLVSGGVASPGLIPILEGQGAGYYIRAAGGVDRDLSASGTYVITDITGTERPADGPINPGDRIDVARDGFVYNFQRYFPVITTGLGFITTIITLVTTLTR